MKVAIINLPTMRPTMPPYTIGVLGKIVQSIETVECEIFDFNLSFWDSLFSKEFNIKANLLCKTLNLDKEMPIEQVAQALKNPELSYDFFQKISVRMEKQFRIYESLYDVKASFGEIRLPDESLSMKNMVSKSQDSEINIFYHFLDSEIQDNQIGKYDLIIMSVMCKEQLLPAFTVAHLLKDERVKIAIGGSFVNRFSEKFRSDILSELFDYILIGDGELLIPYCINRIKFGNDQNGDIVIDMYDIMDREKSMPKEYNTYYGNLRADNYYNLEPILPIMASRGCYYHHCAFCDNAYNYKNERIESQSADSVIVQMKELEKKYGVNKFYFIDDCLSPRFLHSFCQLLLEENKEYMWVANVRFSKELSDENFVRMLAAAGCKELFLGMESYSEQELARMKKGIKTEWILPTLSAMKKENIVTYISVMLGFPGQTIQDYKITKQFLFDNENLLDMVDINVFKPTPYSEMGAHITNNIACEEGENFCNYRSKFRTIEEEMIIEEQYNELMAWVSQTNKVASYWNRNHLLR